MTTRKARLGRGLDGLIQGSAPVSAPSQRQTKKTEASTSAPRTASSLPAPTRIPGISLDGYHEVPLERVTPSRFQPRRDFSDEALQELAESIRAEGLLQPIVVRRTGEDYEIVAGERRWRACKLLRLKKIPARIVTVEDGSAAILALVENLQREDLNPIEEALGYAVLLRDFNLTQEAVSERVGKSRSVVANALRLLQLDREVQGFIAKGLLSVGHAKVLLGVDDPAHRSILARRIIENGLSVRATEQLAAAQRKQGVTSQAPRAERSNETLAIRDLEKRVSARLNTPVSVRHTPKRGRIVIEYFGNEDLQRILEQIGVRL